MDNRLNCILSDGDVIYQDDSRKIIIDQAMELGGSAVVYKARIIGGSDTKSVLVKEIFPAGCNLERAAADTFVNKKGQLFAYSDNKKLQSEYASRYMKFIELARKEESNQRVAALNEEGFRSDYFFSPSEYIPAEKSTNGNCYLILDTTAGDCLKKLITEKADSEKAVHTSCGFLSTVLSALEIMHKKGIRHLDVAPDNIFVSDTGIARLIDYNSASCADDDGVFRVSYKKGFSAPEIKYLFLSPEKVAPNDVLNDTVDLYSVAAILYTIVYGTIFEYNEYAGTDPEISRRHLEKKLEQQLSFITPRAGALLKRILSKGLAASVKDRYQTAKEMRSDIEELKKLISPEEKYLIGTKHLTYPDNCISRDGMLQNMSSTIHEDDNHCVIVSGVGGCGKSELSIMYALAHTDEYDTVCVASYDGDIQNMLCDMKFHGIDISQYENEDSIDMERMYRDKAAKLSEEGSRTLLIIEDYTASISNSLNTLLLIAPNCHIIINTREVFSSTFLLPVEDITDDEAYQFFCRTSGRTDDESADIRSIINVVNKHILLMKLLALHLQNFGRVTAAALLEKLTSGKTLEDGEFEYSTTRNGVTDISSQATIDAHLAKVFSLSDLSEQQCLILSAMTIVPYSGMKQIYFECAMKLSLTDNTVNSLVKYGWITKKNGVISLHQAISDYLYRAEKTRPDWEKLDEFIESEQFFSLTHYDKAMTTTEKNKIIANIDFFCKKINGDTIGCGKIYTFIAVTFCRIKENTAAFDMFMKAKSVLKKHNYTELDEMIYYWTGIAQYNSGHYEDAIKSLATSATVGATHLSTDKSPFFSKSINDNSIASYRYYWIALSHYQLDEYDAAITNWYKSYYICFDIYHEICANMDKEELQYAIGYHDRRYKYQSALDNLSHSLDIFREVLETARKTAQTELETTLKSDDLICWFTDDIICYDYKPYKPYKPCYKSDQFETEIENIKNALDICIKIYAEIYKITENVLHVLACSSPGINGINDKFEF